MSRREDYQLYVQIGLGIGLTLVWWAFLVWLVLLLPLMLAVFVLVLMIAVLLFVAGWLKLSRLIREKANEAQDENTR